MSNLTRDDVETLSLVSSDRYAALRESAAKEWQAMAKSL